MNKNNLFELNIKKRDTRIEQIKKKLIKIIKEFEIINDLDNDEEKIKAYRLAKHLYFKYKTNNKKNGLTVCEIELLNKFWMNEPLPEFSELILLRKIAYEAKILWDKNRFNIEDVHIKNLLADYIDLKERLTGDFND